MLGTSSTQKQTLSENKDQLLRPLDSLAMFIESIMTQTPTDGKDYVSSLEAHLIMSDIKEWVGRPEWFFLRTPVARALFPYPPGAIVKDPSNPTDSRIPNLSLWELTVLGTRDPDLERTIRDESLKTSMSRFQPTDWSTSVAPVVYSEVLANPSVAFLRLNNQATKIRKILNASESKKAYLITGVTAAIENALDHSEPNSSWSKISMAASRGRFRPAVGVSSGAEESISLGDAREVVVALKHQAIWFTRFSKQLRTEIFYGYIDSDGVEEFAKTRRGKVATVSIPQDNCWLIIKHGTPLSVSKTHITTCEGRARESTGGKSSKRRDTGQSGQSKRVRDVDV